MKKAKIALWIFILFILQSTTAHYMSFFNITPILIFSFIASLAILEQDLRFTAVMGIICGICAGTLLGYDFFLCMLFVSFATILVFLKKTIFLYTSDILKALIWTAIISVVWEVFGVVWQIINSAVSLKIIGLYVLIRVVYNSIIAFIVYPLLKNTVYPSAKRKKYKIC